MTTAAIDSPAVPIPRRIHVATRTCKLCGRVFQAANSCKRIADLDALAAQYYHMRDFHPARYK